MLKEFQQKGGLKFLPKQWQGKIVPIDEELRIENPWYWYIIGTIKRTEEGLKNLYKMALPACLVTLLLLDLMRGLWTRRWSLPSCLVRGTGRLLVLHCIVVLLAYCALKTIDASNWAKDIVSGKSYRLPDLTSPVDGVGRQQTRATLPTETDILVAPHYDSDYLAAYGRVIDFAHPGNVKWRNLTNQYAQSYLSLSHSLQKDFCQSLLDYIRQDARFLKQGNEREWLSINDREELANICHQDLVAASDKRIAALIRQINSLTTTTKYGRFRNTAMQREVIPQYLKHWETILVPKRPWSLNDTKPHESLHSSLHTNIVPTLLSTRGNYKRKYSTPKSHEPREPFPLAWVQEGDVVEALYDCNSECKLYMQVDEKDVCDQRSLYGF